MPPPERPERPQPQGVLAGEAMLDLWEELRALGEGVSLLGQGLSMWPCVPPGSILELRPCASTELTPGELVTFRLGGRVVTHRVFLRRPDGAILAWGDARPGPDPLVPPEDVFGRATLRQRGEIWSAEASRQGALLVLRWLSGLLRRQLWRTLRRPVSRV